MFHLDNNSGIDVMPRIKQTLSRLVKWFTEGDSQTPPSYPGADWFNIVQAELLNVLKDAEIEPDKAQLNQLSSSIKKMILSEKVKLSSAVNSSEEDQAATSLAVKNTYDLAESANNKINDLKHYFSYSSEHNQAEVHSKNQVNHFVVRDDDLVGLYSTKDKDFYWLFYRDKLTKGFIDVSQVLTQQRHEENGFVQLPGGIILQWLTASTDNWGALDVTLPLAFPSKLLSVFVTEASAQNWTDDALYSYGYSSQYSNQSTIRVHSRCAVKGGEVVRRSGRFSLLAIGY